MIDFFNFGGSGPSIPPPPGGNGRLFSAGSWPAWAESEKLTSDRVWMHNPFGIYLLPGDDDRKMWFDQWSMAKREGILDTDPASFKLGCEILRDRGVNEIITYIGSPNTHTGDDFDAWHEISIYREAGCSIGFDATYDWTPLTHRIIKRLRDKGTKVYVEPGIEQGGEVDGCVQRDSFVGRDTPKEYRPLGEWVVLEAVKSMDELREFENRGATLALRNWKR